MTYPTIDNLTTSNLQEILKFSTTGVPMFWPVMLMVIFLVIGLGSFFRELRREGKGNLLSSFAIAGYVTSAIALIMTLMELIQGKVMVICLTVSLVFQALFLLTKRRSS